MVLVRIHENCSNKLTGETYPAPVYTRRQMGIREPWGYQVHKWRVRIWIRPQVRYSHNYLLLRIQPRGKRTIQRKPQKVCKWARIPQLGFARVCIPLPGVWTVWSGLENIPKRLYAILKQILRLFLTNAIHASSWPSPRYPDPPERVREKVEGKKQRKGSPVRSRSLSSCKSHRVTGESDRDQLWLKVNTWWIVITCTWSSSPNGRQRGGVWSKGDRYRL